MDKKDMLIVAIVAVVASLAVSAFAPQVGLGPSGGSGSSSANLIAFNASVTAHACNADGICEGNAFDGDFIGGSWGQIQRYPEYYGDGLLMRSEFNEPIHFRTPSKGMDEGFNDITIDVDGKLIVRSLDGNGTAHVCVDAHGTLYRSYTLCNT